MYLHPSHPETDHFLKLEHIKTPLALQYQKLLVLISQALERNQSQPLSIKDQEMVDFYQNSIEIKKIYDVIIALKRKKD